ncbi:SPFH domain-containing protein [Streptomyces sp. NRRL F-2664]|uniref:SPFH domain-containing protein n=1 Tax=Streptomyces sp. NRRL F-2664 TaxID=1463842 RepID=UPI001EFF0EC0|nr:SPFH domain-containing protein [Streptomyces sp. NRRL F-2664]
MYPTRTTTTTGTLRVPAAPAPAPTTFGWATTTPTLSLRLPPPPDPTTPAPTGGALPGASAPQFAPADAARSGRALPGVAAPEPAAAAAPAVRASTDRDASSAGAPEAAPASVLRAVPAPAGEVAPLAADRCAAPQDEAGAGAELDVPAWCGPAAAPGPRAASASTGRAGSRAGAPEVPASVPDASPAPAGERAPLAGDLRAAPQAPGREVVPSSAAGPVDGAERVAASAPPAASTPAGAASPSVEGRRAAPQAPDGAGAELDVPAWCGPAARGASASTGRVPSRAGAPARTPDAVPSPAGSRAASPAGNADGVAGGSQGAEAGPGLGPAPVAEPVEGEARAGAAAVQPRRPVPPGPYAAPAAPAQDAPAVVPAPAGEVPAPGRAAERELRPAGYGTGAPAAPVPHGVEPTVPAAREQSECESDSGTGGPDLPNSGVPGPGVADIVALAVARGMGTAEEDDDTLDLPKVTAPHRGTAVTEVPVHFPFHADAPAPAPAATSARIHTKATAPADGLPARPRRAAAPGRRVPRGDDRLREHRGPVLPGWVGVAVGGLALAGCTAVLWRAGVVPAPLLAAFGAAPRAYRGLHAVHWPPLAFLGIVALVALGGLGRARAGHAWVLTLFGRYRGTVRRTGLTWVSPLLLRRRVDVRLRHWRSDPMPAVDSGGLALQVVVQVVWQVKDTARATLAVADHTEYLAEQVESAMARVLSQLPADAFHEDAPSLRDAEAVGDALTRMLAAETEAVGIDVFSAQPTRIEYAPEVAEAMRRRRVAAIDAKHRDAVLTSVVDAVDDTVHRLTSRGLVELDDYERKALVKDLTVAFCTGRTE